MSRELRVVLVGPSANLSRIREMLPAYIDGAPVRTVEMTAADAVVIPANDAQTLFLATHSEPRELGLLASHGPVVCILDPLTADLRTACLKAGALECLDASSLHEDMLRIVLHLARCVDDAQGERRKADHGRKTIEGRLHNLIERNADGIVIIDHGGTVTFVNPAGLEIFGRSAGELVGHPFGFPLVAGSTAEIEIVRRGAKPASAEMRVVETTWDERPALLATLRDVTQRKALEEQLRQSQKMEAVGRLAGGVAHEFNNLLTAITGSADLVLSHHDDPDGLARDVHEIKAAAARLSAITRQLLTFSRRHPLRPNVFDARVVVRAMESMLRREFPGIDVAVELAPEPAYVKAEENQIQQVVMNLAANARDAMPLGGRLTLRVAPAGAGSEPGGLPPGEWVALSVSDTGRGIDPQVLPRIFEPFFTTKEHDAGAGLGLAIVYSVVRQCGGHVRVETRPGQGATFRVLLPRATPPAARLPGGPGNDPATDAARQPLKTILLVEDQDVVRTVTRRLLQTAGYKVIEASDGQQAFDLFLQRREPLDLLLTDVVMPVMSGVELAERVAARRADLPILYMSGFTRDEVLHDTRTNAPAHFIQKPFTRDQLLTKVRDVLAADAHA